MKIEYYKDARREWRWRIKARNGCIVAASSEGYRRRANARANLRKLLHLIEKHYAYVVANA